jgi:hypothetical protein
VGTGKTRTGRYVGIGLIVEMLDTAPDDLTPAERLLLVAIAEKARENTRECWPGIEVLMRRTGLGKDGVGKVFQRLAARGYEVRVPLGKNKKGEPVFSYPGQRTTYRLPCFTLPADEERSDGGTTIAEPAEAEWSDASTSIEDGATDLVVPASGNGRTVVRDWSEPSTTQSLTDPSRKPSTSSSRPEAVVEIRQRIDLKDDDEALNVIEEAKSRSRKPVRATYAFIKGCSDTSLTEIRDELRQEAEDLGTSANPLVDRSAFLAHVAEQPDCEHRIAGGHIIWPGSRDGTWVQCAIHRRKLEANHAWHQGLAQGKQWTNPPFPELEYTEEIPED